MITVDQVVEVKPEWRGKIVSGERQRGLGFAQELVEIQQAVLHQLSKVIDDEEMPFVKLTVMWLVTTKNGGVYRWNPGSLPLEEDDEYITFQIGVSNK